MAKKKAKYYVVWAGKTPGIYDNWTDCQLQVSGWQGARFKSFDTLKESEEAFEKGPAPIVKRPYTNEQKTAAALEMDPLTHAPIYPSEVISNSIAVDGACSGNPGMMEYRGVYVATGQELFRVGPFWGTNNIGEFLALVHVLAYMDKHQMKLPIYSDSRNAISWIAKKKCRTKLPENEQTAPVWDLIRRGEKWLKDHRKNWTIIKWETAQWGEIPADFGRK
ncbi:MAG: ribonuclease H family protein [Bacteroidaceae bacterium]